MLAETRSREISSRRLLLAPDAALLTVTLRLRGRSDSLRLWEMACVLFKITNGGPWSCGLIAHRWVDTPWPRALSLRVAVWTLSGVGARTRGDDGSNLSVLAGGTAVDLRSWLSHFRAALTTGHT